MNLFLQFGLIFLYCFFPYKCVFICICLYFCSIYKILFCIDISFLFKHYK